MKFRAYILVSDELTKEDIFDYFPPQKTNQIFTPRPTVKDMVDRLEQENPGCYDDPDKTFIDMYMKSAAMQNTKIFLQLKMVSLFLEINDRIKQINSITTHPMSSLPATITNIITPSATHKFH